MTHDHNLTKETII